MLADEFGVEPMPETTALYEQIKAGIYDKVSSVDDSSSTQSPPHPIALSEKFPTINILTPMNRLIGPEEELTYIEQKLRDGDCRLLTVTGMGGAGKTRLALEVARRLTSFLPATDKDLQKNSDPRPVWLNHDRQTRNITVQESAFLDRVYFISLLHMNEPIAGGIGQTNAIEALVLTIAQAVGFSLDEKTSSSEQLLNFLSRRKLLLVLDNFEHLLPLCSFVQEALQQLTTLKILVTSRVPLHITGEWTLPINGLPVRNSRVEPSDPCPASELFLQRTR